MKNVAFDEVSPNYDKPAAKPEFDKIEIVSPTKRLRRILIALGALAVALLVAVGIGYYIYASGYESTDDAFIEGHSDFQARAAQARAALETSIAQANLNPTLYGTAAEIGDF